MSLKFSIIIPSLNQGKFISQTIESVLKQSYKNVEIIVVDGGSTDDTLDILKSYNNQIAWLSEKDNGQTNAINKGIAMSNGDIIAYLNSDDYYLDGTLEIVATIFNSNKNTLWVTGDYIIINENGGKIQSYIIKYKKFLRKLLSFNLLSVLNPIAQPSTFMHKLLIAKVGNFNESLHYAMDYEYWLRAISIKNPTVTNKTLSAFRIHHKSKGGSQYKVQFQEEIDVARKFQSNRAMIFLHQVHNKLIKTIYMLIK